MTAPDARPLPGGHVPVMLDEVLKVLDPSDGGIYVDATFGAGGYSRALLDAADCRVWAIDRDPQAIDRGDAMSRDFQGRLTVIRGRFGDMSSLLGARDIRAVDGIAFDLGISSLQLDDPARGFSFRFDAPLTMRMEGSGPGVRDAGDVVNTYPEGELADIIYRYGEERASRRIARAIVADRVKQPIQRTGQLADIVRRVVGRARDGLDPATRTFMALRIYVNDELGELDRGLVAAEDLLAPGGRLAVVSFHSLEDRSVKSFLRRRSGSVAAGSRHRPPRSNDDPPPTFELVYRRPLAPSSAEAAANPRARSAKLRAATRTRHAPWGHRP